MGKPSPCATCYGKRNEGPFCALLSEKSRVCAACLQVQENLSQSATYEPCTVTCSLGLCDTAVPVRLGDRLIAFLQTGQVFRRKPTDAQYQRTTRLLSESRIQVNAPKPTNPSFATTVMPPLHHT